MPKMTIERPVIETTPKYPAANIRVGELFDCPQLQNAVSTGTGPFMRIYSDDPSLYRAVCLSSGHIWEWPGHLQAQFFPRADFIPITATLVIDHIGDN